MTAFHFTESEKTAPGTRLIEVPAHIESKRALFDFLAQAFPLPAYFGHNWDALEECLLDLDWLADPRLDLVHHDLPLENVPSDQKIYLRILAVAASPRLRVTFPAASREGIQALFPE